MTARYTVIGAHGFVGRHVVTGLQKSGFKPWCPQREDRSLWSRDLGRVIYCAGLTGDFRSKPFATVEAHVSLLARLAESASFDRIVYLSSTRLYDLLSDGIGKEDRPIPVDPTDEEHLYELSKLLGENLTLHRTSGRGAVARLSYVFGCDEHSQGFLSDWLNRAPEARILTINSSDELGRDYIHVDDVANAVIALADSNASGIVNVASGKTLTNDQIAGVFRNRGWDVVFTREPSGGRRPIPISSAKLAALGVTPRPVLAAIDNYLTGLSHHLP